MSTEISKEKIQKLFEESRNHFETNNSLPQPSAHITASSIVPKPAKKRIYKLSGPDYLVFESYLDEMGSGQIFSFSDIFKKYERMVGADIAQKKKRSLQTKFSFLMNGKIRDGLAYEMVQYEEKIIYRKKNEGKKLFTP